MKITEIFESIDGEGKRAGSLVTFIRTYGCPLRCSYCDSMYSVDDKTTKVEYLSVDEILSKVDELGHHNITITGGEPLIQSDMKHLLEVLGDAGYDVNVETSGSVYPEYFLDLPNVWYTIDYKLPSSDMEDKMENRIFELACEEDVIKFVIGSDEDLNRTLEILKKFEFPCAVYLSPVFGFDSKKIVEFMISNKLETCKIQLQLHKYIWDPDMRGV